MRGNLIPPIGPGQRTSRNEANENREIRQAVLWFFIATEGLMIILIGLFFVPKLSPLMAALIALLIFGLITFLLWRWQRNNWYSWVGTAVAVALGIYGYDQGSYLRVWLVDNLEFLLLPAAVPAVLSLVLLSYCMAAEAVDRNGPTPPRRAISWAGTIWPWTNIESRQPWRPGPDEPRGDYHSVMEGDQ